MAPRHKKKRPAKKPFLTDQRLALLLVRTNAQRHLAGEQFWRDQHRRPGAKRSKKRRKWRGYKRSALVRHLLADGKCKRWALVCAGGLGKSANLEWLEYTLAASNGRQLVFRFELKDDRTLPHGPHILDDLLTRLLPERIRAAVGAGAPAADRLAGMLRRYRDAGRITLLLDSLDQAKERGLDFVHRLVSDTAWKKCPVVISSRPDAIYQQWDSLIGRNPQEERAPLFGPDRAAQRRPAQAASGRRSLR